MSCLFCFYGVAGIAVASQDFYSFILVDSGFGIRVRVLYRTAASRLLEYLKTKTTDLRAFSTAKYSAA